MNKKLRHSTVLLVKKSLQLFVDTNVVCRAEQDYIVNTLDYLERKNELPPETPLKMLTQEEAASMMNISEPMFRKMERLGRFPFQKKRIGTSVRYRNTDIIAYLMSNDTDASLDENHEEEQAS